MIMFGHIIVLCLIQYVTIFVPGHMLGHVTSWGLGYHMTPHVIGHMWVSQDHMVRGAPSALGYSWALGSGFGDLVVLGVAGLGFGSSQALLATSTVLVSQQVVTVMHFSLTIWISKCVCGIFYMI